MSTNHQPYSTLVLGELWVTFEVDGSDVLSAPVPFDAMDFLYLTLCDIAIDHGVPLEFVTLRFSEREAAESPDNAAKEEV